MKTWLKKMKKVNKLKIEFDEKKWKIEFCEKNEKVKNWILWKKMIDWIGWKKKEKLEEMKIGKNKK